MSIPYVVDGETDLDSLLFNPIIDRINNVPLASITPALGQYGAIAGPTDSNTVTLLPIWDRGQVEWIAPNIIDVGQPGSYQVDLTGTTDGSSELQGAMDDIETQGVGAILRIPHGRVRFSETLTWKLGVMIEGEWGSGDGVSATMNRWPYLLWAGDSADNAIETESLAFPNNWTFGTFRRILLVAESGHWFKNGVVFTSRVDSTAFTDFQIVGAMEYAMRFEAGGINVVLADWRTDGCKEGSIYWLLNASDSLTLDRFTTDNQYAPDETAGRVLYMDGDAAQDGSKLQLTVRGTSKIETNYDLQDDTAHFEFHHNPANTSRHSVQATFIGIWEAPGSGITKHDGIRFVPPSDFQDVTLIDSKLNVLGVPSYANSRIGTAHRNRLTVLAPHSQQVQGGAASEAQAVEFLGELNVIGSLYHHAKKSAPITHAATSDLSGVTIYAGDLLMDPATRSSGHRIIRECTGEGTLGTLAGVTGTVANGGTTVTVSDASSLHVGQWIALAGGFSSKRIILIDDDTVTIHNGTSVTATTDGALTWVAPTFRNLQIGAITGQVGWDPSSVSSGSAVSTTVTATGAAVGDLATASFSIALPAGCFLVAEVTATNTVTVTLVNVSGSSQNVATGIVRVQVRSQ